MKMEWESQMRYFWYQKTMIGRWGANLSDTAPSQRGIDGTKKLPMGPIYDLKKLTDEQPGDPFDPDWVDLADLNLTKLIKRFPPPADEASAPVAIPEPPRPPLPPAEAPVAPPLVPEVPVAPNQAGYWYAEADELREAPIPVPYGTVTVPGSLVNEAPTGKPIPVVWSGDGKPPEWDRPVTMSPTLAAPYGLGREGTKAAYVAFAKLRLNTTHPRQAETFSVLWRMKISEGFGIISHLEPGAAVEQHIARAAELIPGWLEDFETFQRATEDIV